MHRNPYDSSKTRVCPAFIAVQNNPMPFFRLLSKLGIDTDGAVLKNILFSIPGQQKEKSLNPNPDYLRWLLNHPDKTEIHHKLYGKKKASGSASMRLKLISANRQEQTEAIKAGLKEIDNCARRGQYPKRWFVLEGATKPDVFIETNKFCLIVEGKRTEGTPKIDTEWKRNRHQTVRHLEGLRHYVKQNKLCVPAYGIFIVREQDRMKFNAIYNSLAPFEESLPHAAAEEVIRIKEMYRGCLSWGDIHKAYDGKIRYIDHIKENGLNVWCDDYDPHKE